uniref:CBM21 domain-containing protein n=1 Tax=Angiostrongylus cantonensis TaxID=6313 RepID=A0A0K0DK18_ANGCA
KFYVEHSHGRVRNINFTTFQYNPSHYSNLNDREPISPDSGFSSDESGSPLVDRFSFLDARSRTLPSALRCSQKSVCTKRVRFADTLGLNLEIRQYFTEKESTSSTILTFKLPSPTPEHRLVLSNFIYHSESEYNQRACDEKVCLAKLCAHNRSIIGQVNVANISFTKEVVIRYTTTNWAAFDEVTASYGHSVFGADNVDAFLFLITLPSNMKDGQCQFCVRFTVNGCEFWDNNRGANYRVDIMPKISFPAVQHDTSEAVLSTPRTNSVFTPHRLRRWRRAQEESDDESSHIYIPYHRTPQ